MAYGKLLIDKVENSDGNVFDFSHNSLTGTDASEAHPASSITTEDGGTVQDQLDNTLSVQIKTTDTLKSTDLTGSLSVGDIVETFGYYSAGDGGGNTFEIVDADTGTDDGGSYIDLVGGTMQAKGLFLEGSVNPAMFGAPPSGGSLGDADDAEDATDALKVALDYWMSSRNIKTCDFQGRAYAISDSIALSTTPIIGSKRLTNGTILAKSSYSSTEQMLDFSNNELRKNSSIDNMTFMCGGNAGARAPGGLKFDNFSGITIDSVCIDFFSGSGIKVTGTGAAGESRVVNCYINGDRDVTGADCIGIEWDKGDCEFFGNTIRLCKYNMYLRASALMIVNNHLWCSGSYPDDCNIYSEKAQGTLIHNNYIDDGRVVLYTSFDAPRRINVNDNKWVLTTDKSAEWVAEGRGWIELGCNDLGTGSSVTPRDITIQGNIFGSRDGENQPEMPLIQTVGDGWPTDSDYPDIHDVHIKNNAFTGNQYVKGSTITKAVEFDSQSSVSIDFSNHIFNENWDFKSCLSVTLQTSSDAYVKNVRKLNGEWVVYLSDTVSGKIVMTVDANSWGTDVDDFGVPT